MKTEEFQNPEAVVKERKLGAIEVTDDATAALLTEEASAGRAVYLTCKVVKRLDGVFVIAGSIKPTGIAGQTKSAPPVGDKFAAGAEPAK